MFEQLKPKAVRSFWNNVPPYTTFVAGGVSGAGFAGLGYAIYESFFTDVNIARCAVGGLLSAIMADRAANYGHDNLHAMQNQTNLEAQQQSDQ